MDMASAYRDGCDVVATGHLESAAKLRRSSVLDVGDGQVRVHRPSAGVCVECGAGHFSFFAPQVFAVEVLISLTLLLGVWSRLGSLLGAAMAINLSQGLYRSPGEWPWQYVFLIVVMVQFLLVPPGRSLGLDCFLNHDDRVNQSRISRLLRLAR